MKDTNLFGYATSELSQDAFICWLLSYAANPGVNPELEKCAWEFIRTIPGLAQAKKVTKIKKQVAVKISNQKKSGIIDVLLTVDNYKVIIEDKIFSSAVDSQLDKYVEALNDQGEKNVIGVFYRPVSQLFDTKYFTFKRGDLFKIFNKYKGKTSSDIFEDYVEYLQYFEDEENVYQNKQISIIEWSKCRHGIRYNGFFEHLKTIKLLPPDASYGYVNNKAGGFSSTNWEWKDFQNITNFKFTAKNFDGLYLQIENNKICVKMDLSSGNFVSPDVRYAWDTLRNYFYQRLQTLGVSFKFVKFGFNKSGGGNARWMTVGYIFYDGENYQQQITLMQQVFNSL